MHQYWIEEGRFKIEEQHLACQVRSILKTKAQGPRATFFTKMQQKIVALQFDENIASGPPMKLQKKLRKN